MRAPIYLKQRSRYHTVYNFHAALPDQKVFFTSEVDAGLKSSDTLATSDNLNRNWHRLKLALLNAARSAFPKQITFKNFTISELYGSWNRFYPSFCPLFLELFSDQIDLINQLPLPNSLYSVFISSNLPFKTYLNKFKGLLRPLKRLISAKLKLEFTNYKQNTMRATIAEQNANFYEDKGKFIRSEKNENVVGPSRSPFKSLNELPERWQRRYTLIIDIDPDIYQLIEALVMAPIDNLELMAVINNSPSRKAPGPSSIPYEWFKLLSTDGISYLCRLMNLCLASSDIPEDWRLASIVPIPKPHEFKIYTCSRNLPRNTRPITLLETARKLLVKIITDRLSKVMATHQVLTGDNFAGLPGSTVITSINVLDGIMKSHRISSQTQELWILSQDISKALTLLI
ncbi:unnamed protein product [Rhizophagus irregularis]|nr:unnamed protein product [Rhizophagus irregularis]